MCSVLCMGVDEIIGAVLGPEEAATVRFEKWPWSGRYMDFFNNWKIGELEAWGVADMSCNMVAGGRRGI